MTDTASMRTVFETIYREDQWTNGSGPGSHPDNTIEYRAFLARFIEANAVVGVTDLGCGDWQFSRFIDWSRTRYTGLDIVPSLVERNAKLFGGPTTEFRVLNSISDLPGGDLCVCKDVFQHLPNATIAEYLDVIVSRYRFAILTNMCEPEELVNTDIAAGGGRPLRFDRAPFNLKCAVVLSYFPQRRAQFWKNGVFLIFGNR